MSSKKDPLASSGLLSPRRKSETSDVVGSPRIMASPRALDKPKEEESHIRVLTRVRPFNPREIELHAQTNEGKDEWDQIPLRSVVEFEQSHCIFLDPEKEWSEKERFHFDQCYWSIKPETQKSENGFADQSAIYEQFGQEILEQTWKGYNTCFFAYGQTGSGKTYSMMGDPVENPGIIPQLCRGLFEQVDARKKEAAEHREVYSVNFRVEVRYIEIYNELVKDLLWTLNTVPEEKRGKCNPENMKIRNSPATGVFIENLTSVEVDSWQRMLELIDLGNNSRHTAATKMNERSSRSHAIFKISLRQITTTIPKQKFERPTEHIREAQINLVDLAGSERNKKTGATGDRLKEAASINKSLSCLKGVIDVLADNSTLKGPKKRIPYRESHLTALLSDSLGGNSKTYMLVCLSPHIDNTDETFQTLRYGARARQIVNVVKVNENAASRVMMELEEELERMKENLDKTLNCETVDTLKVAIAEQEQEIQKMESEREQKEKQLQADREARRKEMHLREAAAFANLHALAMARTKKEDGAAEHQKHSRRFRHLERQLVAGQSHLDGSEKHQEELREATEKSKQTTVVLEHDNAGWERKHARLLVFKRELIRTVDDQLTELRRIKDDKYNAILKARLLAARITVNQERRLKQLQKEADDELLATQNNNLEVQKKISASQTEKEETIESQNTDLAKQCSALEAEIARVQREKASQIKKLEEEKTSLMKEHKSISSANASRIRQTEHDWDKKHAQMCIDMQEQYDSVQQQSQERHLGMIKSKEEAYTEHRTVQQEKRNSTIGHWETKRGKAVGDGDEVFQEHEAHWKDKFNLKMRSNEDMRAKLRATADRDKKYSDMAFRIDTVIASLVNPKWKGGQYKKAHQHLTEFRHEYRHNEPSHTRLSQLLRADYTLERASQAPVLAETVSADVKRSTSAYRSATPLRAQQ